MKLGAIDRFGTIYTKLIPDIDKLILSADKWTYTNSYHKDMFHKV